MHACLASMISDCSDWPADEGPAQRDSQLLWVIRVAGLPPGGMGSGACEVWGRARRTPLMDGRAMVLEYKYADSPEPLRYT